VPFVSTTYTVTGFNAAGCKTVATITQTVSTCVDLSSESEDPFSVFPNPFQDVFFVSLAVPSQVYVTDNLGRVIMNELYRQGDHQIDLSAMPAGVYIVEIKSEKITHRIKTIKL
jgi:hypothetical protein